MTAVTTRTLLPAMEGLVEDVELTNTNYLTENRVYSKIGSTSLLASDPAMVHFGGFQLGMIYKHTVRVRNVSGASTRVHIIPPKTTFFKSRCDDKKGLLAPGMAEVIEIEFCPKEYKYYYDCIKIHSEEENLLIPIHGYPVMNETKFPKRVDFGVGKIALGDKVTKKVKMECKVPIDFEYEITITKPNPSFKVSPLTGVVPAHGHVAIAITFEPLDLCTQTLEMEVRTAEFGSQPVTCTVTGSATPGLARDRILQQALMTGTEQASPQDDNSNAITPATLAMAATGTKGKLGPTTSTSRGAGGGVFNKTETSMGLTMGQLDGSGFVKVTTQKLLAHKGGGNARGGAGGGDAYTNLLTEERKTQRGERDCRLTGPIKSIPPQLPSAPADTIVDGVYVPPTTITNHADMTYVLNQQPGKLRIKDVKEAIRHKQAEQENHRAALDTIMAQGLSGGVHPLERPEVPAHIKAALFEQLLSEAEEHAKKVSLGSGVEKGQDVMCAEEVAEAQRLREDQHTAHQMNTERQAAQRLEDICEPAGALHLPLPSASSPDGGNALIGAAFAATPQSMDQQYTPAWRLIEANDLEKRAASMVRFQRAVWRVVYTARLKKALARIQAVLAQLGWDKQRLAEESANPVLLCSEADRPGTAPTKYLKPDNVRTRPLPLYRDINFTYHGPVGMSHYTDFDELGPHDAPEPLEYKILGYSPEDFPGLTPYLPPLLEQPLEEGAVEEMNLEGVQPSGVFTVADVAALPGMPDAMKQPPFTTLEIGNRYTTDKVYAFPEPSWGLDDAYKIQPALFPYHDSSQHEALASGSVRALTGVPLLSSRWLPRSELGDGLLLPEVVQELLLGPDPNDILQDAPDDADKPALTLEVPRDEDIAKYLPPGMPNVLMHRPGTSSSIPQGGSSNLSSSQQPMMLGVGQEAATGNNAAKAPEYELLRQRRQQEVDVEKRQERVQALSKLQQQIQDYNGKLKMPCTFAVHL